MNPVPVAFRLEFRLVPVFLCFLFWFRFDFPMLCHVSRPFHNTFHHSSRSTAALSRCLPRVPPPSLQGLTAKTYLSIFTQVPDRSLKLHKKTKETLTHEFLVRDGATPCGVSRIVGGAFFVDPPGLGCRRHHARCGLIPRPVRDARCDTRHQGRKRAAVSGCGSAGARGDR